MGTVRLALLGALTSWSLAQAAVVGGDAQAGAKIFQDEYCIKCHSVNGQGGKAAPDLGKRQGREFTPATLASMMWNHAPQMWSAMKDQGIVKSTLSPERSADLFAYLYSARFFDAPGDAGRGKQLFASKYCSVCHAADAAATGKPINQWAALTDPVGLVHQMWSHATQMKAQFAQRKVKWVQLTPQELNDILVYVNSIPRKQVSMPNFTMVASELGEYLFKAKGCADCHTGKLALDVRLKGQNLTGVAASMWNHAPKMAKELPSLNEAETRRIVSHIWWMQFVNESGNAARGEKVFAQNKCGVCHNDPASGAPSLKGGNRTPMSMVSALWQHGPRMLNRMQEKNVAWPNFQGSQMADLIAYLNK